MVRRGAAAPRLVSRAGRQFPPRDLLLEVLETIHQSHIGADPSALSLRSVIGIVHAQLGVLVQAVGDYQTGRATRTLLTVHQNLLSCQRLSLDSLTQEHEIAANVGVVVPGYVDILGLVGREHRFRGRWRPVLWDILESSSKATFCSGRVRNRRHILHGLVPRC